MRFLHLFFLISFSTTLLAQEEFKQNDLYLEIGGNGFFTSVNYERQMKKEPAIGFRLGVGMYYEFESFLTIPMGVNYLFPLKRENTFIDAGLGITLIPGKNGSSKGEDNFINVIPSFGYRKHTSRDIMWRIALTPIINKYAFAPWVGFSLGKRF